MAIFDPFGFTELTTTAVEAAETALDTFKWLAANWWKILIAVVVSIIVIIAVVYIFVIKPNLDMIIMIGLMAIT